MKHIYRKVFISYRREPDKFLARLIYKSLKEQGFYPFLDVANKSPGRFDEYLTKQIVNRAHFVVVLSPASVVRCTEKSDWLRKEIEFAVDMQRNIVPLFVDGFDFREHGSTLTGKLAQLKAFEGIKLDHELFDATIESLCRLLKKVKVREVSEENPENEEKPELSSANVRNFRYFLEKAHTNANNKHYIEAVFYYTEAITLNPRYSPLYVFRGNVRFHLGNLKNALEDFNYALALNPNNHLAYSGRGYTFILLNNYDAALSDFNTAISLKCEDKNGYFGRSIVKMKMGDIKGSIDDYLKAMTFTQGKSLAYTYKGSEYLLENDFESASREFTEALSVNPECSEAYIGRGIIFYHKGEFDSALREFKKALSLDPSNPVVYNNLATLFLNSGKWDDAIGYYTKAIELKSDYAEAYYKRGLAKAGKGNHTGAEEDKLKAFKINPELDIREYQAL